MNKDKALDLALEALEWTVEQGGGPACEHEASVCFCKENNAITAIKQARSAPENVWLYWKVNDRCVVTGPFKTTSKEEAYGPDCIDATPLTVPAAQPTTEESSAVKPAAPVQEPDHGITKGN
jgi:hypothetical protein